MPKFHLINYEQQRQHIFYVYINLKRKKKKRKSGHRVCNEKLMIKNEASSKYLLREICNYKTMIGEDMQCVQRKP